MRWKAVAVHHRRWVTLAWAAAAGLCLLRPMPWAFRGVWAALVTAAFGFLVLLRAGTETRAEVALEGDEVVVRYRGGAVERLRLDELREAERTRHPHPRWVFRFGHGARLALPDESDARPLIDALRARLPRQGG